MNGAIGFVLFVGLIVASGNIFVAMANDAGICYFHGVEHPALLVPGRKIRLESARLEGDNTTGVRASVGNVLNGVLGGIAGAAGGGCLGLMVGMIMADSGEEGLLIGTVAGIAVGAYVGSRFDSGYVAVGSIVVTGAIIGLLSQVGE